MQPMNTTKKLGSAEDCMIISVSAKRPLLRKFRLDPVESPLIQPRNPITTRLILSAGILAAKLAAVGNLTAQIIILLTE